MNGMPPVDLTYELTARARDGKETVVSYNATTFYDRDRKLQGVFAAARDVTERKQFEQALQKSNVELESAKVVADKANLAKSDFLSSMSHELRSPLNAILGFAQLMESAVPLPTASQAARISQILQAGWHLLKLINEILDLAVIESGQVSLSMEHVSLAEVMYECRSMMEPQAQERGIQMTFPLFDNPIFVRADRTRLKQIVINLLSNAIKYNKTQGTVVVDCAVSAPERIRIGFTDTGAGLSNRGKVIWIPRSGPAASIIDPLSENPIFVRADRTRLKQIVINLLSNAIKYNKTQGKQ